MGIDFGARRAGTTAFCVFNQDSFIIEQSVRNKDADEFLRKAVELYCPRLICIDAPLSLPMVYRDPNTEYTDYHYRKCDREVRAMSPMFLGGLTARAMELASQWKRERIEVLEVYPGGLVKHLNLQLHYKDDVVKFIDALDVNEYELPVLSSWHQVDALLAWYSGTRYMKNLHESVGDEAEGCIIF
jgi:predicted nuclease with RNAse H fold